MFSDVNGAAFFTGCSDIFYFMSATLAPASLRVTATSTAPVSAAVEAVRAMPIEQIRAELKRRREQTSSERQRHQLEQIAADAGRVSDRLANAAA